MSARHVPVLLQEVLQWLDPQPGQHFIDGTVGSGGHAAAILKKTEPTGILIGLDRDPGSIDRSAATLKKYGERARLIQTSYSQIKNKPETHELLRTHSISGALLDLGFSMDQLTAGKGFSFLTDEPLDLRFDHTVGQTAADLLQTATDYELTTIFRLYGEEKFAWAIAEAVVNHRAATPLTTSGQLARLVTDVYRHKLGSGKRDPWTGGVHPATKVFQALRIAVNEELAELERGLIAMLDVLAPGGRLAVITFHSLEDRIVKHYFQRESRDCICPPEQPICTCGHRARVTILTKKPIVPTDDETKNNPASRSAKLRVAEKIN